jgi:hypothetical protein
MRHAEACLSLDSTKLLRAGALEPGLVVWRWPLRYGGESRCALLCLERFRLQVCYRQDGYWAYEIGLGSDLADVRDHLLYDLPVSWTPCNFGGERPWLHCPRRGCGRRVRKLYLAGRYFLCRQCGRVKFLSQSESSADRAQRRLRRIGRKLGEDEAQWLPERPKGMHRSTYARLSDQFFAAEDVLDWFFLASAARLRTRTRT